ncbi:hypothetical protein [Mycobacterium aquaticum]|uniref:Uncharacterized protein n=1 Tax=Mycobacterium aquaticum TaxID=1927124 RepID=A0A1X0A4Y6_9MYCO|nr:hypothetical protein [Mycobacterium aquaticum]ORA24925.1 hypothetical protein BST13_33700 [Mycobacterium aquaticum]
MRTESKPPNLLDDNVFDDRLIRCTCRHSQRAHQPPRTPELMMQLAVPEDAFVLPPCTRCECQRFERRPTPWRVVLRPPAVRSLHPWAVLTPSGERFQAMSTHLGALSLAHNMASVDDLMRRINRGVVSASAVRAHLFSINGGGR